MNIYLGGVRLLLCISAFMLFQAGHVCFTYLMYIYVIKCAKSYTKLQEKGNI